MNIKVGIDRDLIYVDIKDPRGQVHFSDNSLFLVLDKDNADKLSFQLGSALQEMERK